MSVARVLHNINPQEVWHYFEDISSIPRCSKYEEKIRTYVRDFARVHALAVEQDSIGNIVIKKEGTNGSRDPLALQAHVDMVCEQDGTIQKDLRKEAIELCKDDTWVFARGTTVGADNGIGFAMILAILAGNHKHPPLEALLTADEESGLVGAQSLDARLLTAKRLINIDSDREGSFWIGAAGGQTVSGEYAVEWQENPPDYKCVCLTIRGLRGGHSGVMIHEGRVNAIKLLFRLLNGLPNTICLYDLNGGGIRSNAIPREATVSLSLPHNFAIDQYVEQARSDFSAEFGKDESDFLMELYSITELPSKVFTQESTQRLIKTVLTIPDGPLGMSRNVKGIVESSSNLAGICLEKGKVHILASQRSLFEHLLDYFSSVVMAAIQHGGGKAKLSERYPAWQPLEVSTLMEFCVKVFEDMFSYTPKVEIAHAGLECGALKQRLGNLDVISIGAHIEGAHSPLERVNIKSVARTWEFFLQVLRLIT